MAYNSYVILDQKIVIVDTVDAEFAEEWLEKCNGVEFMMYGGKGIFQ